MSYPKGCSYFFFYAIFGYTILSTGCLEESGKG